MVSFSIPLREGKAMITILRAKYKLYSHGLWCSVFRFNIAS